MINHSLNRFQSPEGTMQRTVSLLLILLLLVSQSFVSAPHSHAGSSVEEPVGHAARPHVHLCHSGHRHTSSDQREDDFEPVVMAAGECPDHDSDAIYVDDLHLVSNSHTVHLVLSQYAVLFVELDDSTDGGASKTAVSSVAWRTSRPRCALYLQNLSIRC